MTCLAVIHGAGGICCYSGRLPETPLRKRMKQTAREMADPASVFFSSKPTGPSRQVTDGYVQGREAS